MTEPVVRSEPLGGSPLALAAIAGQLPSLYAPIPRTPGEWRSRAIAVRGEFVGRAWHSALAPGFAATGAAADRLRRVADGNGIVVTTGQQPGLFGGPLYTWSKAISALALADEIQRATGIPTAPVFWAATDDADYAEASWTALAVPGGAVRIAMPATKPVGVPMSAMPLGDPSDALDALAQACGATADDRPLAAARAAYRAGVSVGDAYVALLRTLMEPLGIAVLNASHEAVVGAARPFALRALERADVIAAALRDRDAAIRQAGFTPQVAEVAGLSLVFERVPDGGEKRRIGIAEARSAAVAASSAILSPNVLLRPVVERAILPTVSYVAGPGEIAYFAQVSAVATALDLAWPLIVPRWSTTVIEPHVLRILHRFGLAVEDLADPHAAESRLGRGAVPAAIDKALRELRDEVERRSAALADAAAAAPLDVQPTVFEGTRRAIEHRIDRVERRVVAAVKRREADTLRQIGTARGALYPLGIRQERALNALPLLARHGSALLARMTALASEHARAYVGSDAADEPLPGDQSSRMSDARVGARAEATRVADA